MGKRLNIKVILLYFIFVANLFYILEFQYNLFDSEYYFEPAENENLVMTSFLKNNTDDLKTLYRQGIIPIYPTLFHSISSKMNIENSLYSNRLLSVIAYWVVLTFVVIIIFKESKNLILSLILSSGLFGVSQHAKYFMIGRTDGLYIMFGILALLSLKSFYNSLEKNHNMIFLVLTAVLTSSSILVKQSGVYFYVIVNYILFYDILIKRQDIRKTLATIVLYNLFNAVALITFFYFNSISLNGFITGNELYASEFSLTHVYKQFIDLLRYYWPLIGIAIFLIIKDLLKGGKPYILIGIWIITLVISVKVFSNKAAHFNNYIFLQLTLIGTIVWFKEYFFSNKYVIALLILWSIQANYTYHDRNINNVFRLNTELIQDNGPLLKSKIFNFIKNNPGSYITSRNDNFLFQNDLPVIYEASVLEPTIIENNQWIKENQEINDHVELIRAKISNKELRGILTGINNLTTKVFPEIERNYKIEMTEEVSCGDWPHLITLWIPK